MGIQLPGKPPVKREPFDALFAACDKANKAVMAHDPKADEAIKELQAEAAKVIASRNQRR